MSEYGIPYMGSKGSICDELIKVFPKADNFYDLFGGGFSVTHAMMLRRSSHYKQFHFNEIRPGICELIRAAINGKYNYDVVKPEFVTREMFFERLDTCAYTKTIWSFGSNGRDYLFSKDIETYKKSLHNAIVFNRFDELAEKTLGLKSFNPGYDIKQKRFFLRNKIEFYRKTKVPEFLWPYLNDEHLEIVKSNQVADNFKQLQQLGRLQQLERLQQLGRLKQLEQLQRLEQLQQIQGLQQIERLERLEFYNTSYEKIQIKENSIVYCDIPYQGTRDYGGTFSYKDFFDWADSQPQPVFISEYNIDDPRFKLVFKTNKISMLKATKTKTLKLEKVYANTSGFNLLRAGLKEPLHV